MSGFTRIAIGAALAVGIGATAFFTGGASLALLGTTLTNLIVGAGLSLVIGGIGTLLSQPTGGMGGATRNPVAPWNVVYGRAKVGGTVVYIEENGDTNKYLHQVIVLACHPCQSVDALYFDNKRVVLDSNGNSISFGDSTDVIGSQRSASIASISRANDVVTVVLIHPLSEPAHTVTAPPLMDGDFLLIQDVQHDRTLNGTYAVTVIDDLTFTYICGGNPITLVNTGAVVTTYPDYGDTVHMEVLLGNHTATFPGLLSGSNGLWTSQHLLLGHTAVYLRLKYGGQTYANGLPTIGFLVHGKNDIYDPRSGNRTYSENAALCIADYLAQPTWGFKAVYDSEIPSAALTSAANICDEAVTLASGASEARYTCNGSFPLSTKRGEVLQNLLTCCGGRLTYTSGQFVIWPAAWMGLGANIGPDPRVGEPIIIPATAGYIVTDWEDQTGGGDQSFGNGTARIDFDGLGGATIEWLGTAVPTLYRDDFGVGGQKLVGANVGPGPIPIPNLPAPGSILVLQIFSPDGIFISGPAGGNPDDFCHCRLTLRGGGYRTPSTVPDVTAVNAALASAAGPFTWKEKLSVRDLYNGVKGTYLSPSNNWQTSDFPPYAQDQMHGYSNGPAQYLYDANLAADGGDRRWLDIQLPFTISAPTAQRLAKIELLRRRQQGSGTFSFNLALYQCTALDCVTFTLPLLGWSNKLLEITAHRFTLNKQQDSNGQDITVLGTEIDVQETDPTLYDWSATEELSSEGFQQAALPTMQSPQPPTGLAALSTAATSAIGADGIATSRILVTWQPPDDGYVINGGYIDVRYAPVGSTTWTALPQVDPTATATYINAVSDGQSYVVQMRSVNAAGVSSPWQQTTVTAAGAASQINLPSFTVNGG